MKVRELKELINGLDEDSDVVVDYGLGYVKPCSVEVYHQTIPRIGCKKKDSLVINLEGGLHGLAKRQEEYRCYGYIS